MVEVEYDPLNRSLDDLRAVQDLINQATSELSQIFSKKLQTLSQFSSDKFTEIAPKYIETVREFQRVVEEDSKAAPESDEAKAYYRKIAQATHPDRTISLSPNESLKREGIFKEASEAYNKGDILTLQMFLLVTGNDLLQQSELFQKISTKAYDQLVDRAASILEHAGRIHSMPLHEFFLLIERSILQMEGEIAKRSLNPLTHSYLIAPATP